VGCKKSYLGNIEKGPDQPSAVLIYRFARALSATLGRTVDIDEFSTEKPQQGAA
jgi:transcriptional regulator with XRE-family HTH domain